MTINTLIQCPACHKSFDADNVSVLEYFDHSHVSVKFWRPEKILLCSGCGLGIAYPVVNDQQLDEIYSHGGYWQKKEGKNFSRRYDPGLFALAESRWSFVKNHISPGCEDVTVLDIGAGPGIFGMVAAEDKYVRLKEYCAVESDNHMRESFSLTWNKKYKKIAAVPVSSVDDVKGKYDLVVLSHILEHIPAPAPLLDKILSLLKDDGILFVDVPNQDYLFKKFIFPHVLFFNINGMKNLLEHSGYEISDLGCFGKDMEFSPINRLNQQSFENIFYKIVFRLRSVLPGTLTTKISKQYLGAADRNENGTWIRALAKKRIR